LIRPQRAMQAITYTVYVVTCTYAALSQVFFYKYGAPLGLEVLSHMHNLAMLKTSIDHELQEQHRLDIILSLLVLFLLVAPVLIAGAARLWRPLLQLLDAPRRQAYLLGTCLILVLYGGESYAMRHRPSPIIDTPSITLFRSVAKSLRHRFASHSDVPPMDDQISGLAPDPWRGQVLKPCRKRYNIIVVVVETTLTQYYATTEENRAHLPNLMRIRDRSIYSDRFVAPGPRSTKALFALTTSMYPLTSYHFAVRTRHKIDIPSLFSLTKETRLSLLSSVLRRL